MGPGRRGFPAWGVAAAPDLPPPRRRPRKSSEEAVRERQQVVSLAAMREPSLLRFYVSREWLNKFNTFAEPGPITNRTFLCSHGGEVASSATGRGAGGPSPSPPSCAFLRRHPALQIPLHRRPGGDPAPERLGAPLQQVPAAAAGLCRPGRALSWAGGRGRRGDASVTPRRPQAAGQHTSSCGAPLAAVSASKKMPAFGGIQPDPPSHKGQKTGSSPSGGIGPSRRQSWGCWPRGILTSVSPQSRAWLRGPGACAAWGLPGSSPSRPRACDSLVEGRAPGRARVTLDPGGRLCRGRGGGQTGGEGEARETRWTGFSPPTHSSGTARALWLVDGSEPHRERHPQVLWGPPPPTEGCAASL